MTDSMKLKIYNSLTRKKELFQRSKNTVSIYVCGITPYDITHLGHAFTYVFFDVVVRYLDFLGFQVTYVQNVTDVDDDIIRRAKEENINWRTLGEKHFKNFLNDLVFLNIRQPDFYPKATDHIKEIIEFNKELLAKNFAYEKNGNLYFDINKFKKYGRLSRLSKEGMLPVSRERGNDPDDPQKINPLDFVLWQKSKIDEPSWLSPWGNGRPGWHIECSTMSMKYLGSTLDIHGGGADLIYPHHESEIAQAEAVTGQVFARFFMHTAMLYYQGKKMSKSLGNMVFINDLKNKFPANDLRLLFLGNHYRKEWEYSASLLDEAGQLSDLFKKVWQSQSGQGKDMIIEKFRTDFFSSLNDDFNTPKTLEILKNLAEEIINNKDENTAPAKAFLNLAFNILGLRVEY